MCACFIIANLESATIARYLLHAESGISLLPPQVCLIVFLLLLYCCYLCVYTIVCMMLYFIFRVLILSEAEEAS